MKTVSRVARRCRDNLRRHSEPTDLSRHTGWSLGPFSAPAQSGGWDGPERKQSGLHVFGKEMMSQPLSFFSEKLAFLLRNDSHATTDG